MSPFIKHKWKAEIENSQSEELLGATSHSQLSIYRHHIIIIIDH